MGVSKAVPQAIEPVRQAKNSDTNTMRQSCDVNVVSSLQYMLTPHLRVLLCVTSLYFPCLRLNAATSDFQQDAWNQLLTQKLAPLRTKHSSATAYDLRPSGVEALIIMER